MYRHDQGLFLFYDVHDTKGKEAKSLRSLSQLDVGGGALPRFLLAVEVPLLISIATNYVELRKILRNETGVIFASTKFTCCNGGPLKVTQHPLCRNL